MKPFLSFVIALPFAGGLVNAVAQDAPASGPASQGRDATVVYRQVTPDGRVVYSDKRLKGSKIDQTITVEPPIKGNLWSTESVAQPAKPPRNEPTQVERVASIPSPGKSKTVNEADSDVIHAEMLLEDALQRQRAGATPLPGEQGAPGGRTNTAYARRQEKLATQVEKAKATLTKATAARNSLRTAR